MRGMSRNCVEGCAGFETFDDLAGHYLLVAGLTTDNEGHRTVYAD